MNKVELISRLKKELSKGKDEQTKAPRLSQIHICPRFQWFSLQQETKHPDFETLGHYLKGLIWEGWVKGIFPEAHWQREVEFMGIKGHIDFFFPKSSTVLEVKATTSTSLPFLPNPQHLWQVRAYMAALKEEGFENPKGFILYIPVDNPSLMLEHIYEVTLENWMIRLLKERAKNLLEAFESGIEPALPEDFKPEVEPCAGISYGKPFICPFHKTCWGEERLPVVLRNWVDKLGDWIEAFERVKEKVEPALRQKEWVEGKVKEWLKSRDDLKVVEVKGERWRLVAVKENGCREYVDKKAIEEAFGREVIEPFIKKAQPAVRVKWERIDN